MKKIFTFLFSIMILSLSAQSITLSEDTVRLRFGKLIDYDTYIISNTGTTPVDIDCTLRPSCYVPSDSTEISICFGILCFLPTSVETNYGVIAGGPLTTIPPGGSDNSFKLEPTRSVAHGSTWEIDFFDQNDPTNKATLVVMVDNCNISSASDTYEEINFTTAPNPASDMITLNFESLNSQRQISIFNTIGQLRKTENLAPNVVNHTMDISNLSAGSYFIKMTTADGSSGVRKLIVRR